jgi:hypothetical protein
LAWTNFRAGCVVDGRFVATKEMGNWGNYREIVYIIWKCGLNFYEFTTNGCRKPELFIAKTTGNFSGKHMQFSRAKNRILLNY